MFRGIRQASSAFSYSASCRRFASSAKPFTSPPPRPNPYAERNKTLVMYVCAGAITVVGLSYAAVPLYRLFCQTTGFGGTPRSAHGNTSGAIPAGPSPDARVIKIRFNADASQRLRWKFRPQQTELQVRVGETALAFYTAENLSDRDITGIATYNVTPNKAGAYFNKIQCFCFEYQRLRAHETVDMPVFFYIDPEFENDLLMLDVDSITLSYTFFEASAGERILQQAVASPPAAHAPPAAPAAAQTAA